jgi:hypothetical protein
MKWKCLRIKKHYFENILVLIESISPDISILHNNQKRPNLSYFEILFICDIMLFSVNLS